MMTHLRDRIKEFARIPVAKLRANPRNWRTHPEAQRKALRGMLNEIGFSSAVIARELPDGTYELIDGHLRLETLAATDRIPTLILDVDEGEADKLLLTLDPLASMAGTDKEMLAGLFESTSFEDDALASLIAETTGYEFDLDDDVDDGEDAEPQIDKAEELRAKWGVERGQLWRLGEHLLLCGDSTNADDVERVMGGELVNVAFTSPPYASQRKYDEASGFRPIPPDEFVEWFKPVAASVYRNLASDGSWFVNIKPACEGLKRLLYVFDLVLAHVREWNWNFAEEFCWERSGIPQRVVRRFKNQFEPIYQFTKGDWKFRPKGVMHKSKNVPVPIGKGAGDTNAASRQGTRMCAVEGNELKEGMAYPGNRLPLFKSEALGHSAAFPVDLPSFFIKAYSDEEDVVYEPFSGSGTTLIACENLGRKCRAIEISPAYVAVAIQRWADHTGGSPELVR